MTDANRPQQVANAINNAAKDLAKAAIGASQHERQAMFNAAAIGYLIASTINNLIYLGVFDDA